MPPKAAPPPPPPEPEEVEPEPCEPPPPPPPPEYRPSSKERRALEKVCKEMWLTGDHKAAFSDILATLTTQKVELQQQLQQTTPPARTLGRRSLSAPAHLDQGKETPTQNPSTMPGSAKFSFGKPRHYTGKFKIPNLEPRDFEYVHNPGRMVVPGVGAYDLPHSDGREIPEMAGGATGGWHAGSHDIFLRTLSECGSGTPQFFDILAIRLPHVSRAQVADHLRWLADYERYQAAKQRRVCRWHEEATGRNRSTTVTLSKEEAAKQEQATRLERLEASRRSRELREQAAQQEPRAGGRHQPQPAFVPQQQFQGQVLEPNLRGHPELKKSPGYTFGTSLDRRDLAAKSFTTLAHVRSSSHLDAPGPGQYGGPVLESTKALFKRAASHGFGAKLPPPKVDPPSLGGPGYDGELHITEKMAQDLQLLQMSKPKWTFGHEPARSSSMASFNTPPKVGPGKYSHATSLVSQF